LLIWVGRKADDVATVATARQLALRDAEDEYRRLLYVAMTRAADRLIVCGAEGVRGRPTGCWYDLVRGPLTELLVEEPDDGETVWRYRKSAGETTTPPASERPEAKPDRPVLPHWLRELAPAQPLLPVPLSPSSAFDEEIAGDAPAGGSALDRQKALERGRLVHRLMQSLPDIPAERRKAAAEHYLGNATTHIDAAERAALVQRTLAILSDPAFAEIFAAGSRAEVPIVGRIAAPDGAAPIHVSGQIDRLAVSDDTVLIADYKTDRVPPKALGEVKPYVTQLALYRAVLARLYPGKTVRAALLFTEGPLMMEVPAAAMDQAFTALMAKPHAPGEGALTPV
jgi:ATP-dependent helicase/nuclease subunit A